MKRVPLLLGFALLLCLVVPVIKNQQRSPHLNHYKVYRLLQQPLNLMKRQIRQLK